MSKNSPFDKNEKPLDITAPEATEVLPEQIQSEDIKDIISKIQLEYSAANSSRSVWVQNQAKWYRQRYGIRPRPTFPWKNAPFSKDTEILTGSGWKLVKDILPGELVLTRDDKTKVSKYEAVQGTIETFQEKMYCLKNQSLDICVSPEHTMIWENYDGVVVRKQARETKGMTGLRIPLYSEWRGVDVDCGPFDPGDWFEFVGWFVSEGWRFKNLTGKTSIGIGQSETANPEKVERIKALLNRMGIKYSYRKGNQFIVHVKNIPDHLREDCDLGIATEKHIPKRLLCANKNLLSRMFEAMVLGDGNTTKLPHHVQEQIHYFTTSRVLADDVQELLQKIGFHGTVTKREPKDSLIGGRKILSENCNPIYIIALRRERAVKYTNLKVSVVEYNDYAYCVNVPSHSVYVRRNGKAFWSGNSNLHLPLVDKTVRKMKAEYVAAMWSSKPLCSLTPVDENLYDLATAASYHLDWLLRSRINLYPQVVRTADIMLQKGFTIVKTVYEKSYEPKTVVLSKKEEKKKLKKLLVDPSFADIFENSAKAVKLAAVIAKNYGFDLTDKTDNDKVKAIVRLIYEGKDHVEFTVDALVYNAPRVVPLDPECVIVPSDTITEFDLEQAPWVIHRYQVDVATAVSNAKSGKWKRETVEKLLKNRGIKSLDDYNAALLHTENKQDVNRTNEKTSKNLREGQQVPGTDKVIFVHEVCMWHDRDGDGKPERHILEYAEEIQDMDLRFIPYPYDMAMWPYAKVPFELTDGSHYSPRGIVEILNPLAAALNEQHNMKLNRQYLACTPLAFFNTDAISKFEFGQVAPGKPVGVKGNPNTAVAWVSAPNADMSFVQEEGFIRQWGEDISASSDQTMINQSGTATEAKINTTNRVTVRQQDIELWNMGWREVFKRVFALWLQYGPKTVASPTSETEAKTEIILSTMAKAWEFNVNARIGITDPVLEAQKALARVQQFNSMSPQGIYVRQYEMVKDYFEKDDYLLSKKLLKTPKQVQEDQQAQAEAEQAREERQFKMDMMLGKSKASQQGSAPAARSMNASQGLTGNMAQ